MSISRTSTELPRIGGWPRGIPEDLDGLKTSDLLTVLHGKYYPKQKDPKWIKANRRDILESAASFIQDTGLTLDEILWLWSNERSV